MSENNNKRKEVLFSHIGGYEIKESDDGDLIVKGYISTTHLDEGFYDDERGVYVRDRVSKETLQKWADDINSGNPSANKVSVHHNREPTVSGVGLKGTARVDLLPDGEYGLYVETLINKAKEGYDDIKYQVENNILDSFSIEYMTKDILTGSYIDDAVSEQSVSSGIIRTLLPETQLKGWTLASQPMNPYAMMIKEVLGTMKNKESESISSDVKTEEKEEEKSNEISTEETKEDNNIEPIKEETKMSEEANNQSISDEDLKILAEAKEAKLKEAKEAEYAKIKESVMTELKESLKEVKVENKTMKNVEMEEKEVLAFKEMVMPKEGAKFNADVAFKEAAKLAEKAGLISSKGIATTGNVFSKEYKSFSVNGSKLEVKGLGITTNQGSNYYVAAPELNDYFDPVIYNFLNQSTTTWNLISKEDKSMNGNDYVGFRLKTGRNATAGFYTGDAVNTGYVPKTMYKTKFKKASVGVAVSGDMIAAARGGPIGDVFANEVMISTEDLMEAMNSQLFAHNPAGTANVSGAETDAAPISFEYITNSASYTTLYGVARSAANLLSPDSATDTFINGASADISLTNLKSMIRQAKVEGANVADLVFVTSFVQEDKFASIYEATERHPAPTSSRFGFVGRKEYNGVPIFADKHCNSDDWFLLDLATLKIAIWVPPTLEMLGKDSDSEKGFVKTYYALYSMAPRRISQCYGNATS